jgi:hypothetical protein
MNKAETTNNGRARSSKVLELEAALREAGLEVTRIENRHIVVRLQSGAEIAAIPISAGNGRPGEVRTARTLVEYQPVAGVPVLVARRFTPGALDLLREWGVSFLDEHHLVFRSLEPMVVVDRNRVSYSLGRADSREVRLGGQIGVAVQGMLLEWERGWRVTEIARMTGVSVGTAQDAVQRLEKLQLLRTEGRGPRKLRWIAEPQRLLNLWAAEARRERATLLTVFLFSQGPDDLARLISQRLATAAVGHAVTGTCAARLVAPHVTASQVCEVWVSAGCSTQIVLEALGAKAEAKGANVRVLRAGSDAPLFRSHEVVETRIVNDLRLYADLLADPKRGEEQAAFLRETRLEY